MEPPSGIGHDHAAVRQEAHRIDAGRGLERERRAIVARDPDGAVDCAAHQVPPRERECHGADRRRVVDRAQQSAAGQLIHLDHAAAGDRDAVAAAGDHRNRGGEVTPFDAARAR